MIHSTVFFVEMLQLPNAPINVTKRPNTEGTGYDDMMAGARKVR